MINYAAQSHGIDQYLVAIVFVYS